MVSKRSGLMCMPSVCQVKRQCEMNKKTARLEGFVKVTKVIMKHKYSLAYSLAKLRDQDLAWRPAPKEGLWKSGSCQCSRWCRRNTLAQCSL